MKHASTFTKLALSAAMAGLLLTACGGGGGGGGGLIAPATSTLSGTAAGGAAVIGTVIVTDSLGATKGGTIEANGHYTVDVSGMTGPFMLKAAGTVGNTSVTYYSAATSNDVNGTVNVTPFTNLMVSNIAAQLAENYFATPQHTNFSTLFTPAHLAAAQTALLAKLQPVLAALGVNNSIDLLRASFAADHSGLDAVLDMVKIETDTGTNLITIKNAITGGVIATDNATTSSDDASPVSGPLTGITPDAVSDLQAIAAQLNNLATLFATGLPSIEAITNSGAIDTTSAFLDGGKTYAQFATQISTNGSNIGMHFSNVAITLDASGTSGSVTALVTTAGNSNTIHIKVVKSDSTWKLQGDGRIAAIDVHATAQTSSWEVFNSSLSVFASGQNPFISGINIYIDPQAYNASHPGASTEVASAVVNGPGLAPSGVLFVKSSGDTWMRLPGHNWNTNEVFECGKPIETGGYTPSANQCLNIAAAVDNSEYTVVLKNAAGTSLNGAGYKVTLPKQPRLTNSLSLADFPTVTSASIDGNTNITPASLVSGKSLVVGWTLPTGLTANYANVWTKTLALSDSYTFIAKNLAPTATSTIFALETPPSTTPDEAHLWVQGKDVFGRHFGVGHHQRINSFPQ